MKKSLLNPLHLFPRLFNSVIFGISLMVLVAAYIAVGSGFASVREFFEMNEQQFFRAWPLKLLMALLIINLTVVTWRRIPLTPPRYGVWCVHAGIITLILSTSFYYRNKIEGTTRLYTSASYGPTSIDHFYDKGERALYLKMDGTMWNSYPLASLPRFKAYDSSLGNADYLNRPGLRGIEPYFEVNQDKTMPPVRRTLAEAAGWKEEMKLDVIGYFPYANISTRFAEDAAGDLTALRVTLPDVKEGEDFETWLVGTEPRHRFTPLQGTDLEHRHVDAATLEILKQASEKLLHLDVKVAAHAESLYVQPGKTYRIGQTGYTLAIERFDPSWPMFGTREIVQALTMTVTSPTQTFKRMILDGRDLQTDFKLGEPDAGPMGKRQKEPLDKDLLVVLQYSDPGRLLPREGEIKHTLVTVAGKPGITDIVTGFTSAGETRVYDNGVLDIEIRAADSTPNAPFAPPGGHHAGDGHAEHAALKLHLQRKDNIRRHNSVAIVPPARRTRDGGESGGFQVLRVRVTLGDWTGEALVPYSMDAADERIPWQDGSLKLPNGSTLQLALGQTRLALPARLTLDKFDVIPYPGGDQSTRSMMLDFRSTLRVEDPETGGSSTEVAHMNNPIYFGDGSWLFFQAAYDGEQRQWTILGVGNRPGVRIMILGCIMIVAGVLYAFYAKPIIIRRMKQNAIAKAAVAKKQPKEEKLLVAS